MTGRGWTQLIPKKIQKHIEQKCIAHMKEDRIAVYETWHDRSKAGTLRNYVVLFDTTGSHMVGHYIAKFPPTDEGKAAAEECVKAITSALRLVRQLQVQEEEG